MADAETLLADLYRLSPEEQIRFMLILFTGLDDSDQALLKTYQEALDNAKTDPYDKDAYYRALDLQQVQEDGKTPSPNLEGRPENLFDFDLFRDGENQGINARQERRIAFQFANRLPSREPG